jgi:FixJ family two-component response regulator
VTAEATVYVVDDDPAVLRALARLLVVEGFAVVTFGSATEFLAYPVPEYPMCLMLDLRMPGLTGFDLLQRLDAAGRDIPVILMTGHANDSVLEKAVAKNVVTLLAKPFESAALVAAIQEGLARDRARRRLEHTPR